MSGTAMAGAHAELLEAGRAVREARARLHEATVCHDRLRGRLTEAWMEREAIAGDYWRLLAGVLRVLDDCLLAPPDPRLAVVRDGVRGLLAEQGVEVIPVMAGEPFDAELHESREAVPAPDLPAGAIVDVLAPGYRRRDGETTVVVRPAAVRVCAATNGPTEASGGDDGPHRPDPRH